VRDTDKAVVEKYQIQKFPALLLFPLDAEPITYDGALKHEELAEFFSKHALPGKNPQADQGQKTNQQQQKQQKAPEPEPFNPEIKQIKTQKELKEECLDKPIGMCLLSFLVLEPDFEESVKEHQAQLEILKAVKKGAHDKSLSFRVLWIDALAERKLMDKFMLSDQVPSLLIISPTKKVYRPFTGAFEEKSVLEFLTETTKGKGRHFKFEFEPTLSISE